MARRPRARSSRSARAANSPARSAPAGSGVTRWSSRRDRLATARIANNSRSAPSRRSRLAAPASRAQATRRGSQASSRATIGTAATTTPSQRASWWTAACWVAPASARVFPTPARRPNGPWSSFPTTGMRPTRCWISATSPASSAPAPSSRSPGTASFSTSRYRVSPAHTHRAVQATTARSPSSCLARSPAVSAYSFTTGPGPALGLVAAEDHHRVVAAEAEAVRHGHVHLGLAGLVGHVVEVAGGVGVGLVDGRGEDPVPQGQDGGDALDRPGRPEQVPDHRLGRGDGQPVGVVPEGEADGLGLRHVPGRGRGAVGVDVADLLWGHAGRPQGAAHGQGGSAAVLGRGGDVEGVGRLPEPDQLGVDERPAGQGVLPLLQYQGPGTLAHHEAVAQGVERPRGLGGTVVELGRQGRHLGEGDQRHLDEGRLGAAGDHGRGLAMADRLKGQADGVVGGRTGGGGAEVGPAKAELHGDLAGGGVRHQLGTVNGETRLGPLVRITSSLASSELIPPMPVANTTPVSSLSTASSIPLSSQASRAEVRANWVERSSRLASLGPRLAAGSKSRHSAATLDGTGSGSTRVRGPRPDWPAQMASQYALAPTPTGVTAPSPVTTTRCKVLPHRRLLGDHQVGGLADGLDASDLVVGDLDAELLLEGEHDLDQVERVGVEVLLEAGVGGHLVRLHSQLGGQDVLHRLDNFLARLRHLLVLLRAGGHDGGSGCRPCRLPVN